MRAGGSERSDFVVQSFCRCTAASGLRLPTAFELLCEDLVKCSNDLNREAADQLAELASECIFRLRCSEAALPTSSLRIPFKTRMSERVARVSRGVSPGVSKFRRECVPWCLTRLPPTSWFCILMLDTRTKF